MYQCIRSLQHHPTHESWRVLIVIRTLIVREYAAGNILKPVILVNKGHPVMEICTHDDNDVDSFIMYNDFTPVSCYA